MEIKDIKYSRDLLDLYGRVVECKNSTPEKIYSFYERVENSRDEIEKEIERFRGLRKNLFPRGTIGNMKVRVSLDKAIDNLFSASLMLP